MNNGRNNHQTRIVIIGSLVLAIILVAGTMWMGDHARKDTEEAVREVKQDMESSKPMDRLLCGDVGFGKTEVAMVAAFKAINDLKQVAYLCPTTILSRQHYNTFVERFKDFPVKIALINRFVVESEQKRILQEEEEIYPSDMTVLIVDDDPVACQHAQLVLEKAGIASEMASSGKQAINMVKLRHARMEPYNLILVDWKMPEMDGVETTRQIREEIGNESAIIILTAYRWDDVLEEALNAGVDSFLPKPLFATAVLEEFESALKRKDITSLKQHAKADLTGRHILLAEDIDVNAEIIRMVLQMRKMEVDRAENGKKAVELFSEHPEGYYDAILMDMRMPEMDGLEATRTIRAMEHNDAMTTPIIVLTANAFDEDVQRSMQAGLNAHLSKPVQPELLFETLESLIKNK